MIETSDPPMTTNARRRIAGATVRECAGIPIRRAVKAVLNTVGRHLVACDPGSRSVVLCYHSVGGAAGRAVTPRDLFHRHLDWLTAHCHLVPLRHLFEHRMLQEERRPRVALTFDDGHADNYHCVYPLLQRYRAPAAFFVVTGLLARDPEVVRRFPALRALEWGQVREMRDMGMTFGSHSHSHPNLADLEPAGVAGELERSKHVLEQELGAAVTIMAYPFGVPGRHVTGVAVRAAAAAGYELAAAMTCRGVGAGDRMAIPRFCVVRDSVETLRQKVLGAWDVVGVWQERMPLTLARSVERLLGIDYAAAARRAVQDGTASWP